jgi:hypothetical protein
MQSRKSVPSPGVEAPSNSPLPRERQNGAEMPSVLVTNLEIERNGKLKGAGLRVNLLYITAGKEVLVNSYIQYSEAITVITRRIMKG